MTTTTVQSIARVWHTRTQPTITGIVETYNVYAAVNI